MQSQNRIFDDIAKVAGGALGALGSLKQEIEVLVRQRVERFLADHDLVSREEFEAVKEMAAEARIEQTLILARLQELEGLMKTSRAKARKAATPRKSGTKAQKKKMPKNA